MLSAYFDTLKGKSVSVIGAGVSNTPLIKLLTDAGISVTVYDKKTADKFDPALYSELRSRCRLVLGENYLEKIDGDVIFRTPGVRPDAPGLIDARKRGAVVTSEMDVFFSLCPCKTVGITGSDGKTTTSSLIAALYKEHGFSVFLGGNIGAPLLPRLDEITENDRVVVELSSFQLSDMTHSPDVAVITNVTPNHLDWHRDMDEYAQAKYNLLRFQKKDDLAVLNLDDAVTRSFGEKCTAKARYFSLSEKADGCACGDSLTLFGEHLINANELFIPGKHNQANFLTACLAVCDEVTPDEMRKVAQTFRGVEHRIEFVREINGAKYYNDSIGSSPTRTIAGLKCFEGKNIILIAGGYDKHIAFESLGEEISRRVGTLLLCGVTSEKIAAAVEKAGGKTKISQFSVLSDAIKAAHSIAKPGDIVLLSPACASFDQFPNFMVRGEYFKNEVKKLQ